MHQSQRAPAQTNRRAHKAKAATPNALPSTTKLKIPENLHPRQTFVAQVLRYDGPAASWSSVDLSEGGVYVQGEPLLDEGNHLEVAIWLPDPNGGNIEIVTQGRVAWKNTGRARIKPELPPGMGIQFVDLDDSDCNTLREFLAARAIAELRLGQVSVPFSNELKLPPKPPLDADNEPDDRREVTSHTQHPIALPETSEAEQEPQEASEFGLFPDDEIAAVGTVIGSYRILDLVGSGGMGQVFLAEHMQLGRKVAIKKLGGRFTGDPNLARRFLDEARVVNRMSHPNIIEITDFFTEDGNIYYVMELLNGYNLAQVQHKAGALPLCRVLDIAIQLTDAVHAVHQVGVVHRDLKPENIMLVDRHGRKDFVKLLDFGIAKLLNPDSTLSVKKTAHGMTLGTPGYMAPEQLLEGLVDNRSDIYAVGVLFYHMVTNKMPFVASTWRELLFRHANEVPQKPTKFSQNELPKELEVLILQCLEKEPNKRPQSILEVGSRLRAIYASTFPAEASSASMSHGAALASELPREPFRVRPRRTGLLAAASVGLAIIALAAAYFWVARESPALLHPSTQFSSVRKSVSSPPLVAASSDAIPDDPPAKANEPPPSSPMKSESTLQARQSGKPVAAKKLARRPHAAPKKQEVADKDSGSLFDQFDQ